jgi:lysophospholipase L1-like esterase
MLPTSLPVLSSRRQVLTAGFLAACGSVAALELLGASEVGASSSRASSSRASSLRGSALSASATRVSVIGDSLTIGTMPYQSDAFTEAGWRHAEIDAYNSRGIRTKLKKDLHTGLTSVDAIRATSGDSDLWVVALGTNDAGIYAKAKHAEVIGLMMDKIGSGHTVMWVNVYLPKAPPRQENWNSALATVAAERGSQMFVFDWASLAEKNPKWLANDQVHCNNKGYVQRASAIAQATRDFVPSGATPEPSSRPWLKDLAG